MTLRYIDLFCGIGGFRIAAEQVLERRGARGRCVFSCDIDPHARRAYEANFGETPAGDITAVSADVIPDHDILFAGFPCQPFSIIGDMKGFEDTRGTLFFEIARVLEARKPRAFILENVKMLVGHRNGHTMRRIMQTLRDLGYFADYRVLNALDFGLPQKRERVVIVGFDRPMDFQWPQPKLSITPLSEILEVDVDSKHFASERIRRARLASAMEQGTRDGDGPTIWHENKSGHVSVYPFSCALRAGASYNYLLVNGERRLTPREMLRLQGFPDTFKIVCNDWQTRRQAGNAVPPPVVAAVLESVFGGIRDW
ncbi:MAG: DNA (cytosine-5-)-methyltransferase [Armatimonadota bacterium]|nr:DNA (cytosine-5-)-methyltransferase [Armatimonadota bacterium]